MVKNQKTTKENAMKYIYKDETKINNSTFFNIPEEIIEYFQEIDMWSSEEQVEDHFLVSRQTLKQVAEVLLQEKICPKTFQYLDTTQIIKDYHNHNKFIVCFLNKSEEIYYIFSLD
jgi:dsDNA-specific endonuclease/ATPase MutS2